MDASVEKLSWFTAGKNSELRVVYPIEYTFANSFNIKVLPVFLYNIFIFFYRSAIAVGSLWNSKAQKWIKGRKNWRSHLKQAMPPDGRNTIWMHCSSLGEFEQGRPLLDELRARYPDHWLLVTFFSPSGYETRKNYEGADHISYLPLDSAGNARDFLDIVKPILSVFIKYDYWFHYMHQCKARNIPLFMVSSIFRETQPFFKWYGPLHKRMLGFVTHFFVQDNESKDLLQSLGLENVTIAGDTRFDRVITIAEKFQPLPYIQAFLADSLSIVAGSTWPHDEELLREMRPIINDLRLKLIIAPHETHEQRLREIETRFDGIARYSPIDNIVAPVSPGNAMVITSIGFLSRIYHYATVTYVGGGFDKGIHNTLEAAVFGKPVIFGPNYGKFKEARDLVKIGAAFSVANSAELKSCLHKLFNDKKSREESGKAARDYVIQNKGATGRIMNYITKNVFSQVGKNA